VLFLRHLRPILIEQGVQIYENTPVLKIHEGDPFRLITPHGDIRAKTIVLATNAYTGKLGYFRKKILPLHTHVFATPPVQRDTLGWGNISGYADDHVHTAYSSMTDDGHIIFGGGAKNSANYRFNNQSVYDGSPHRAQHLFDAIRAKMTHYLPKSANLPMAYRWTGYLDMTFNLSSSIGKMPHNPNILYALGYNGHGVTLGNIAGRVLTDMYSGDDQQWRNLPFYQHTLPPVPLDPFRWLGYRAVNLLLS
jgi:glycine/D-amino acid oxidase-like deaminating enzyme